MGCFAEIIGVVLDGDAPSAPAGIPTCRNTAFVSAPAGIFLSSHHRAADLIRIVVHCRGGCWLLFQSYIITETPLRSSWTPGSNRRGDINKIGQCVAWPEAAADGRIQGREARFMCRISAWPAWRIHRRCP